MLQGATHFPQVQSGPKLSKQKDVVWLCTKSSLLAACFSPLRESLCMPPDGHLVAVSWTDLLVIGHRHRTRTSQLTPPPLKHLALDGPVLSAGSWTPEHNGSGCLLPNHDDPIHGALEPQNELVPNAPLVVYFYCSEKMHEKLMCSLLCLYSCVWQLCSRASF